MPDTKPEETVTIFDPATGRPGVIPKANLARARETTGARPMSDAEIKAFTEKRKHDSDFLETAEAGLIGKVRGAGEAFGIPVDPLITETADIFGKRRAAAEHLQGLKEWHPYVSGFEEAIGQIGGAVAGGELMGAGGLARAPSAAGRIGQGLVQGAAKGALENVVIGGTQDVNEGYLGDHKVNGEKFLASIPSNAIWGAAAGGIAGGGASAAGEFLGAGARGLAPVLDAQASRAIGRELGAAGEEAGVLGAKVRSEMGGVPGSAREVASAYGSKQAAHQATAAEVRASKLADIERRHVFDTDWQGLQQGQGRARRAADVQAVIDATAERHAQTKLGFDNEFYKAEQLAEKLGKEREAHAVALKDLAKNLDKVEGAQRPQVGQILGSVVAPEGAPPIKAVESWKTGLQNAFPFDGIPFSKMDGVAKSAEQLGARAKDPLAKQGFQDIASAVRAEFDRASAVTAESVSGASGLHAERLRSAGPGIGQAHDAALKDIIKHERVIADFENQAVREMREAARLGKESLGGFEKGIKGEAKDLKAAQKAELRGFPKAEKGTPFDDIKAAADAAVAKPKDPIFSGNAALMALISLAHGNVPGAALGLGGSLLAGAARARSNIAAAKVLSSLATSLGDFDRALERGAYGAVRKTAEAGARAIARAEVPEAKPRLSFEKVVKQVRQQQANPMILESKVRMAFGPMLQYAPQHYSSTLESAQRAQAFLEASIPPARRDPFSPTAHLEKDAFSDSEKYDYMQSYQVIADPLVVFRDAKNGSITTRQVETMKAVYPGLYRVMQSELQRGLVDLQKPLEYEKSVHLGTLMGVPTSEVMEPSFQQEQAKMYAKRAEEQKIDGASKPRGANSRLSHSSGAQQVESGEAAQ